MIVAKENFEKRQLQTRAVCQTVPKAVLGKVFAVLLVGVLVAACTVKIFPEHEPAIIDGLNSLNAQGLTFFVSLACIPKEGAKASFEVMAKDCVGADSFSQRKNTYDELIGVAESVIQLVNTRPQPQPFMARFFGISREDEARKAVSSSETGSSDTAEIASRVTKEDVQTALIKAFDAPTDNALETLITNLRRMRDRDKSKGLKIGAAIGHKKLFALSMRNALTFEMALNR